MSRSMLPASLLLALALAAPVFAQDVTGSGTVTESSRPIAGAPVLIDGTNPVLTDQDGHFTTTFPAGDHKIKVALHGYQPKELAVTAVKDKAVIADFALDPVLQIMALTVPATLTQATAGKAQLLVKNTGTAAYSVDQVGLRFPTADGKDRSADFTVQPDAANPASIKPGETATLNFTLTPADKAAPGKLTVRASLFAFDTAMGKNMVANGSFEAGAAKTPTGMGWYSDPTPADYPGSSGAIVDSTAITGTRSAQLISTEVPTGDRTYWSVRSYINVKPGGTYVLSGYVKTQDVVSDTSGAAVYVPVVNDNPYQQPNAPWITGTRDWRKDIIVFHIADDANNPQAVPRGELQDSTGTAWFDNISLTQGTDDGSLTVTGGDQPLEVKAK